MLARNLSLAAASAARVQAIDTVYADFRNMDGPARRSARKRGATASPPRWRSIRRRSRSSTRCSRRRLRRSQTAQAVVAAFAADPSAGVVAIGGVMYDRPHLTRAQRLLARVKPASQT